MAERSRGKPDARDPEATIFAPPKQPPRPSQQPPRPSQQPPRPSQQPPRPSQHPPEPAPVRPSPDSGPPSSERTQMFVQGGSQPSLEGQRTAYMAAMSAPTNAPTGRAKTESGPFAVIPDPPPRQHQQPQQQPMPLPQGHRPAYGSSPEPPMPSMPGSQPPPGYALQTGPQPAMPMHVAMSMPMGSGSHPAMMNPQMHPGGQAPPPMMNPAMGSQAPPPMMGSQMGSQAPPGHLDPRRMAQIPGTGPPFRPAPMPSMPPGMQPNMGGPPMMGPGMAPGMGPPTVLLQGTPDPRLVLITDADSARAASFRLLRDNLLAKRLPRVLAISSAAKKDGKTTCALNLALSLSEGAKVLLLEGNQSDPELAKIFCIPESTAPWPPNCPWLGPYRIVEFSRTLHVGAIVLNAGQPAPRFEKTTFDQMIANLRRFSYDFILIDAASLSVSPTVSQLVAAADATLLAVRSGITTARALRRATEQIPEGKAIGIALVDTTPTT